METQPREEVKKEKFPTPGNPLMGRSVRSLAISEGNITGKKKTKNREYAPSH